MKKNEPVIRQTTQKEGVRENLFLYLLNCYRIMENPIIRRINFLISELIKVNIKNLARVRDVNFNFFIA
jgi:hypothetical protein